ncbi:MAG: type II toxin-antitoxin system ParD family antitoxin [Bradyrhizobium sp.]|nr:type II toxin-antitoxin system ParD family antitoxin [Bradyrhizobium sp.]
MRTLVALRRKNGKFCNASEAPTEEELLQTLVKSGRYHNASEVLRDGLRLVEQRVAEDAGKLKALRVAATDRSRAAAAPPARLRQGSPGDSRSTADRSVGS